MTLLEHLSTVPPVSPTPPLTQGCVPSQAGAGVAPPRQAPRAGLAAGEQALCGGGRWRAEGF